ncbi:50S ribosomal protein L21 [Candidatus Saccharibacteria bacterium]|nr:50S ribosomal protein L21 [Candidatus Saccharibacteria bacterium]
MEKKKTRSSKSKSTKTKEEKLAVLGLGGGQHLVREGAELEVNRLPFKKGEKKEEEALVLKPRIAKGKVIYKVSEHTKGPKLTVQTYKAKSRYRRKKGFRASLTKIVIETIKI